MLPRLLRTANFKLALSYALAFGGSVLALGAVAFLDVRYSLDAQLRLHVEAEIRQLMRDYQEDGIEELRHDVRERMESREGQRLRYSIVNAEGKTIFDPLPETDQEGWHETTLKGRRLLAYTQPLDHGYHLTVAADLTQSEAVERAMLHAGLLIILGTLALGVLGGLWVSRRFLRRVDALGRTADSIGRGDLSQRIPVSGSGDDFDQLAGTINQMLGRIELLVSEVQHVSTSIAHDLRTPLSQLRYKLERMGDSPEVDDAVQLLDETLATFSALLQLTELESGVRRQHFAPVDLSSLLAQVADAYAPAIAERGTLERRIAPGLSVAGDANLLRQLFANLIENALTHGGDRAEITIALRRDGAQVEALVADRGPGIPANRHAEVLRPFYRLDASRSTKGNGLGLSLVAAILRLHDATLTLADHRPGLAAEIRFKPLK